ncbi:MAG: hypothetical protein HQ453_02080 [Actinobacteria bacterium]|nr:hypothetical protein [Actinomycetota bacterium]
MAAPAVPMMTVAAAMTPAIFIRFINPIWREGIRDKPIKKVIYITFTALVSPDPIHLARNPGGMNDQASISA